MSEKRTGAKFTYSIKAASGYRSKMEGTLRGPEHHAVVSAAADGEFVDDLYVLLAAPELLEELKRMAKDMDSLGYSVSSAMAVISKAENTPPDPNRNQYR